MKIPRIQGRMNMRGGRNKSDIALVKCILNLKTLSQSYGRTTTLVRLMHILNLKTPW